MLSHATSSSRAPHRLYVGERKERRAAFLAVGRGWKDLHSGRDLCKW